MKEIVLSNGAVCKVDDDDYGKLSTYTWSCKSGRYAMRCERARGDRFKNVQMHREVIGAKPGEIVDHINGDTFDNRKANLRICSQSQNMQNSTRRRDNVSGYKGVHPNGRNWAAQIKVDGKQIYLGTFKTKEEAARVYNEAAAKHFGEFARVNDL